MKKQMNRADACERMNHSTSLNQKRNRKGYSLGEALIVVAIVVVLLAIAIPSVIAIRKNMRQTELDTKAEIIYEAVQNQLMKMRASGTAGIYQYKPNEDGSVGDNGVDKLGFIPWDADATGSILADDICYITSGELLIDGTASSVVMGEGVVDEELRINHWVIEYDPSSGSVYSVFYSEGTTACDDAYKADINYYDRTLRDKSNRRSAGAEVGYYTGETIAKLNNVRSLRPELSVSNAEKLEIKVVCTVPIDITDCPVYKVQLTDVNGNTNTRYYSHWSLSGASLNALISSEGISASDLITTDSGLEGRKYTLELTLDDLSSEETRFDYLYGQQSSNAVKLDAGTPLEITVTALCPGNHTVTGNRKATAITNSLFADANCKDNKEKLNDEYGTSASDPAVIIYGRHLQNMDASSGVDSSVQFFVQGSDISFSEVAAATGIQDWYETYHESYFNGLTTDGHANFKPIVNSNVVLFEGKLTEKYRISNLHVESTEYAGLFGELRGGQQLSYVQLAGATIVGTTHKAVGSLVGLVYAEDGEVLIDHCQGFLAPADTVGKNNRYIWISGATALGGLVGHVENGTLTISNSSASTVLGEYTLNATEILNDENEIQMVASDLESDYVGGLVGIVNGGTVNVKNSYADNYLAGKYAGGLIGKMLGGSVSIDSSYAAGFITFDVQGAGMVNAENTIPVSVKNSYTIMYRQYLLDNEAVPFYAIASGTCSFDNVYFEAKSNIDGYTDALDFLITETESAETLASKLNIGSSTVFTKNNNSSRPYNLMGQALTTYTYPGITDVAHYGDWKAEFQPGALVYYEIYRVDANTTEVGFYGANVESTLREDLLIIGDGYGFVYRNGAAANLPEKLKVYVGDNEINNPSTAFYGEGYQIKGNEANALVSGNDKYLIYPLDKTIVNAAATEGQFYTKVVVSDMDNHKDYYYYNPLFAKTVVVVSDEDVQAPSPNRTDCMIAIRTARHLYDMSLYYDEFAAITVKATYLQERNIDYASYQWTYANRTGITKYQAPIGTKNDQKETAPFISTYNGMGYWITNISVVTTEGLYTGLFGINGDERNIGIIENVVLMAEFDEDGANNCYVARNGSVERNQSLYQGVLVGKNSQKGQIYNSAVSGYYLSGPDGTIHAYDGSYVYAGGLVGANDGIIENCSADTPSVRISSLYATVNVGGFVGLNSSVIRNCYSLGHIEVAEGTKGTEGSVSIAGFAGRNAGNIRDSYCVTALTASGDCTQSYGFAPKAGSTFNCTYLNGGTYSFINHLYSYNFNTNLGSGTPILYGDLKLADGSSYFAKHSYNFQNTSVAEGVVYPFRAVVHNMNGELVHYGDWLDDEELGSVGMFYWEHEVGGSNDGYHLTFLGVNGESIDKGTTLCTAHDDGGVIVEYGYGYYEKNLGATTLSIDKVNNRYTSLINGGGTFTAKEYGIGEYDKALENLGVNIEASKALNEQIFYSSEDSSENPYFFFAFTTRMNPGTGKGDYFCMNRNDYGRNTTITLTYEISKTENEKETHTYQYVLCPFFANAMQLAKIDNRAVNQEITLKGTDGVSTTYTNEPGLYQKSNNVLNNNPYEIRSIMQLQYINWNNRDRNYTNTVDDDPIVDSWIMNSGWGASFPYESSSYRDDKASTLLQYSQTHDIQNTTNSNGDSTRFYPLGRYARPFKMRYNGNSYQVKNLWIEESSSGYVGLFGQLGVSSFIENMILTADEGKGLIKSTYHYTIAKTEPAIGAFAGMAYIDDRGTNLIMENCSASGYDIVYQGEAEVGVTRYISIGGLIGSLFSCRIENCSAANHIQMNGTIHSVLGGLRAEQHLGGLVGSAGTHFWGGADWQASYIVNCYSGGSISSVAVNSGLYSGGLVGDIHASSVAITIAGTYGYIQNCYTYCSSLPEWNSRNKAYYNDRHPLCGNPRSDSVSNCYYLERDSSRLGLWSAITYEEMIDGTLLSKLNNRAQNFSNVTTTEGNMNISGKYTYPVSSHLMGKDYPFPAVVTQRDANYNRNVTVHYGDWPLADAYWTEGRGTMDIFQNMQEQGYAVKTFEIDFYDNNTVSTLDININVVDKSIAEIESIGTPYSKMIDGKSHYIVPVNIRALNTGSTVVNMTYTTDESQVISFVLEITAKLELSSQYETISIRSGASEAKTVEFWAKTPASEGEEVKEYSTNANGFWSMIPEEENVVTGSVTNKMNVWSFERQRLGETVVEARYTYNYPSKSSYGEDITIQLSNSIYLDVDQPETIGLSDNSRYSVAFTGTTNVGSPMEYGTDKPENTLGDFYIYSSDSQTMQTVSGNIKTVTVDGIAAEATDNSRIYTAYNKDKNDNVLGYYHIEISENLTIEEDYTYLPGTIYYVNYDGSTAPVKNVELSFVLGDTGVNGHACEYTLTIRLGEVENKASITVTYFSGTNDAEGNPEKYQIYLLSGDEFTLIQPADIPDTTIFTTPVSTRFVTWQKVVSGEGDQTVYEEYDVFTTTEDGTTVNKKYTLNESIELYAKWITIYNIQFVFNEHMHLENPSGYYDEGTEVTIPKTQDITTDSGWRFMGWYSDADCISQISVDSITADVDKILYAGCFRDVSILLKDALDGYVINPTVSSDDHKIWMLNNRSYGMTGYQERTEIQSLSHSGYELLGWYLGSEENIPDDATPGVLFMDTKGNFLPNVMVEGVAYTDANGKLTLPDSVTNLVLYAYWGKVGTEKTAYAMVDSLEKDGKYIIVDSNEITSATNEVHVFMASVGESPIVTPVTVTNLTDVDGTNMVLYSKEGVITSAISDGGVYALLYLKKSDNDATAPRDHLIFEKRNDQNEVIYDTFIADGTLVTAAGLDVNALDWQYDAGSHRLYAQMGNQKYWLGAELSQPDESGKRISTGKFVIITETVVSGDIENENTEETDIPAINIDEQITASYLYKEVTGYKTATFKPKHELTFALFGENADSTFVIEVEDKSNKLTGDNWEALKEKLEPYEAFSGWVERDGKAISVTITEDSIQYTNENGVVITSITEDLYFDAKWSVKLAISADENDLPGVTFVGNSMQNILTNLPSDITVPSNYTGWYGVDADGKYSVEIADNVGNVINLNELCKNTVLKPGYLLKFHLNELDPDETTNIVWDHAIVQMTEIDTELSSVNGAGWYTRSGDAESGYSYSLVDNTASIDLNTVTDLYAGWNLNLHKSGATDSMVVFATTESTELPEGNANFSGWYSKVEGQYKTIGEDSNWRTRGDLYEGYAVNFHDESETKQVVLRIGEDKPNGVESQTFGAFEGWYTRSGDVGNYTYTVFNDTNNLNGVTDVYAKWSRWKKATSITTGVYLIAAGNHLMTYDDGISYVDGTVSEDTISFDGISNAQMWSVTCTNSSMTITNSGKYLKISSALRLQAGEDSNNKWKYQSGKLSVSYGINYYLKFDNGFSLDYRSNKAADITFYSLDIHYAD